SADEQVKAIGDVLTMEPASSQVQGAKQQIADWQDIAQAHRSRRPAIDGLQQFQDSAKDLNASAILISAPKGIGAVTPASLLLKSGDALYVQSNDEINLAAAQRMSLHANQAISLLAQQEGMRLVSGKGPLEIESHDDVLNLIAQKDITLQSVQGHLQLTAKKGITLGCGGGYIRITPAGAIDIHTPGKLNLKGQHVWETTTSQSFPMPELPQSVCEGCLERARKKTIGLLKREG
ncbi:type VI secretion system tip protein VgrG, partial [Pseudomonas syringae pv. actinidifoliorum]|uniref:DUF2345 domain-containing protein n=1 Tax=Pseudomonas syringae TaxID=317 RepID=UPI0013726D38